MKKLYFLFLPPLILIVFWFFSTAFRTISNEIETAKLTNQNIDTMVYSKVTIQDRTDFTIDVNPFKITAPHDTVLERENRRYSLIKVPVRLSNHTDLPLKYIVMSCSWNGQFLTSNKNMKILCWPCQYNAPVVCVLRAHKDTIYTIPVVNIKQYVKGEKFKIAMSLFVCEGNQYFDPMKINSFSERNLMWSNEVSLPW